MLEKIDGEFTVQYKFNLNPEHLDAIFKLIDMYAYRGEASIMKLDTSFSMKEGVIRLYPVQILDDHTMVLRAAGCQMSEMPSAQLLHLLPDYDGVEKHFHWIHEEVRNQLSLDTGEIESIINKIFENENMLTGRRIYFQSDGSYILNQPRLNSDIKLVDCDPDTIRFYSLYGNCSETELLSCRSLEISTELFLNYALHALEERLARLTERNSYSDETIYKIAASKELIEVMIARLRPAEAMAVPAVAEQNPSVLTANTFFREPPDYEHDRQPENNILKLTTVQIKQIVDYRTQLEKEVNSKWPYPNKNKKRIKINALDQLLALNRHFPDSDLHQIVAIVKRDFPRALDGETLKIIDSLIADPDKIRTNKF